MDKIIKLENVSKTYKVLNRREGLKGSFIDLFSKDYKYINAINEVSFGIQTGEMVGFLGANGAGKSTLIKMMTGIIEPSSGNIMVNGINPSTNRVKIAKEIGVVFGQRSQLWWNLPVIESFNVLKDMYQIDDCVFKQNMELYSSLVNVEKLYSKPIRQMSLGQRTLCDILAAFLHNPKIVFLDEPTIGLDVLTKDKIRKLVSVMNKEKKTTVILTTHDMGDVEVLCERVIIINKGNVIFNNSYDELKHVFGKKRIVRIRLSKENDELIIRKKVEKNMTEGIIHMEIEGEWIKIIIDENKVQLVEFIENTLKEKGISDLQIEELNAEENLRKIYEEASGV